MWISSTKAELLDQLGSVSAPIILVPTMGALHAGHASLIELARKKAGPDGTVIVSIFVNPIQFDRESDLRNYPRPIKEDLAVCSAHGADGVFTPFPEEMYHPDRSVIVMETQLASHLCGSTRPGHFDGVCTIVLKLFNLTRCDAAVFGEKDFQQLAIINRMARDLDLNVDIISHPTIREKDGLAMSSRNSRLAPEHRMDAPRIHIALQTASTESDPRKIVATAIQLIEGSHYARIDYLSLVDAETLAPAINLDRPSVLACAVFYGDVRLIDHIRIAAQSNSPLY